MEIKLSTLTVGEVAEYLGLSKDMIYKMTREKAIPHIRIGRRLVFKLDSIEKWLSEKEERIYE